jgi:hypothetical protein
MAPHHRLMLASVLVAALLVTVGQQTNATGSTGACASLTTDRYHSPACDAEIAAHPAPDLERPVKYTPSRDGMGEPLSFLFPTEPLPYPVGWQNQTWYFSDVPGVRPTADDWTLAQRITRGTMVYVYHSLDVNGTRWHLIGPDQWMADQYLSVVYIPQRPAGVVGRWAAVDVSQQTLVAMNDDLPIYAALVSTGAGPATETDRGVFQIFGRAESMLLSGPPGADPPEYAYRVKWAMFFNGAQALHSASYHNDFGTRRSHGCVNLTPGDAEWLWNFFDTTAQVWDPSGPRTFEADHRDAAPWIVVYESAQPGQ